MLMPVTFGSGLNVSVYCDEQALSTNVPFLCLLGSSRYMVMMFPLSWSGQGLNLHL